jgi:CO/xanthine dehydrogenase Mo-binding subunit
MGAVSSAPPSTFGVPALRSEDPRFLRGEGRYLENVAIGGALRAVFVRSIMPHAALLGIDGLDEARRMPGVAAVFTAVDLDLGTMPPAGNGGQHGERSREQPDAPGGGGQTVNCAGKVVLRYHARMVRRARSHRRPPFVPSG